VKEIGPLPPVADPARRERCRTSLKSFFTTYLAARFPLPFSRDHDKVIRKLERCITKGGQFANAMPRGSGKTTMVEAAIVWAIVYGHRKFVVTLAATGDLADELVQSVKDELETNDLLLADFPEVCHPIRRLEGIAQRGKGQTLDGERTRVGWGAGEFRLAYIPGAASSGAVVEGRGLDGAIRGRKKSVPGGRQMRPDLLVLDDPQTDLSARMLGQTEARERLIEGAVLGMAGPGKTVAAVMPCTVICPDDLSTRVLRKPQWNGERTQLVDKMPTNLDWWKGEYAEARRESMTRFGDGRLADALYERKRAFADAGADIPWAERFDAETCASALQEAMNWLIDRPASFWAEAQNEPMSLNPEGEALALSPTLLAKRLTGVPRGVVPRGCGRLTAGVDVSEFLIWWVVTAWDDGFGGSVIDYGCWPPQGRTYFRQEEAAPSLRGRFPDQPVEAAVYSAVKATLAEVMGRVFPTEEGADGMQVERCLVDSSDQTATVYDAIRASGHKGAVWPSKGFGSNASRTPVGEWPEKPGDRRRGQDWVYGPTAGAAPRLLLKFGANEWKSFLADRFRTPEAAAAALRLFGDDEFVHQLFADHCAAETPDRQRSETTGRVATVWTQRPGRQNHLFDCAVLSAVAASIAGVRWSARAAAGDPKPARARRWVDIDELNRAAGPGVN